MKLTVEVGSTAVKWRFMQGGKAGTGGWRRGGNSTVVVGIVL